jgi:hypothetical protein
MKSRVFEREGKVNENGSKTHRFAPIMPIFIFARQPGLWQVCNRNFQRVV